MLGPTYDLPNLRPQRVITQVMRIQGGAVVTEHGILRSDDYVPGMSGWCIFGDGTCEFNDGTFRGEIDAAGLNIRINAADDGAIEFYSLDNRLIGRMSAEAWEIGDLETPGLRATLDPVGGLRFRNEDDSLSVILDQQGLSLRDEETGLVTTEVGDSWVRLVDPDDGSQILISTDSDDRLANPRYKGAWEINPSSSIVVPASAVFTANDLELGHVAAYVRALAQTASWSPPAGWTEVADDYAGVADTLATSVFSRGPATATAGTGLSNRTNWQHGIGTHVVLRGVPGGTTPSVRSFEITEVVTADTGVILQIPKPAGTTAGDVLVVFIAMGNSGGSVPVGWVTPEGWVFLGASIGLTGSGTTQSTIAVGAWAYLAGASEPATYETVVNFAAGTKTVQGTILAVQDAAVMEGGAQIAVGGHNTLGAWEDYTPSNTNVTVGDGSQVAKYLLMGKTCFVSYTLTFGASTSLGGVPDFGLPFTVSGQTFFGAARCLNSGTKEHVCIVKALASQANARVLTPDTAGAGNIDGTVPFTFGSGDSISFTVCYEVA